jgi:hypothetical protein
VSTLANVPRRDYLIEMFFCSCARKELTVILEEASAAALDTGSLLIIKNQPGNR